MSRHIVAAVQMNSGADKSSNLRVAERLVKEGVARGAALIVLPELFNCLAKPETIVAAAEPIPGPSSTAMSQLAAEHHITLVAGSIAERTGENRIFNTSMVFGPDGSLLERYRKLHLFDINLTGAVTFCESKFMDRGERIAVTPTNVGQLGQATCYDLRFPELFRLLVDRGAQLLVIPSAFTMATGRDHWEVLLRARAIENQCFVIAPNQFGHHDEALQSYGRSMIVDPWGTVLSTAPDGEGVIIAEIDFERLREVRCRLPCLDHRRKLEQLAATM